MLKRSVISALLIPATANAVNPYQIAQVASVAANMYTGGTFGSSMNSVAGVGFAFGDLLTEIGVDPAIDEELKTSINRIEDLQSQMSSYKDSGLRIQSLAEDLKASQSLEDRLRIIKTMIQISKALASVMSASPDLGEKAFKVQDVRLNYMILDELMAIRRLQYQQDLAKREQEARLGIALAGVNEEEQRAARKRSNR